MLMYEFKNSRFLNSGARFFVRLVDSWGARQAHGRNRAPNLESPAFYDKFYYKLRQLFITNYDNFITNYDNYYKSITIYDSTGISNV